MENSNIPVVTVEDFCNIVKMQFNENNKRAIFGLGKGGIGKSESIASLAQELGIGYVDIRLLLYSEVDLKGIPYPDQEHTFTIWLQNNILPTIQKNGDKGILVLDEITSCDKSLRTAAYQLLNERKLGEYILPDGWLIVCLGNGEEDGGDFQGMEGNFANRCSVFNVICDLETWKKWGYKSGINDLVLAYVSWAPNDLHTFDPEKENDILFASPRSWKAVSDILNCNGYSDDNKLVNLRIIGNIGSYVGHRFLSFCKLKNNNIDPMDIVNGKPVGRVNNLEVMFITIQSVLKIIRDSIQLDNQSNNGCVSIQTILKIANSVNWFLSLNSLENQIAAIKDLINMNRQLMIKILTQSNEFKQACPGLLKFASDNREVFIQE